MRLLADIRHWFVGCEWEHRIVWRDPKNEDRGGRMYTECRHCRRLLCLNFLEDLTKTDLFKMWEM